MDQISCAPHGFIPDGEIVPFEGNPQQSTPARSFALGKRSRMRMGLPEYYNTVLERPSATAPGYDLIHVDVRAQQPADSRPVSLSSQLALTIAAVECACIAHLLLRSSDSIY